MNVRPYPDEPGRYFVQSRSRDIEHTVDMEYIECPGDQPRPACGCEEMMAKGKPTCPHVKAVEAWLRGQQ